MCGSPGGELAAGDPARGVSVLLRLQGLGVRQAVVELAVRPGAGLRSPAGRLGSLGGRAGGPGCQFGKWLTVTFIMALAGLREAF